MAQEIDGIDVDRLNRMMDEVDSHPSRVRFLANTARGWRHYHMDKWWVPEDEFDDMEISDTAPTSRENVINRTVKDINSLMLKNDPIVHTHPHKMEDADLSNDMDKMLLAGWRNANTRHVFRSMHKDALIGGLGVGKTFWNLANKRRHPDGDVGILRAHPQDIRFDPYASNDERARDCRYMIHTTRQTPEAIWMYYGKEGAKAIGLDSVSGKPPSSISKAYQRVKDAIVGLVASTDDQGQIVDRRIEVHEYWIFPLTKLESELTGGELIDEKKYPYGAVLTMIANEIVRSMPNPFYHKRSVRLGEGMDSETQTAEVGHRLHPFTLLYWSREADHNLTNGIYDCEGATKQQIPIQLSANGVGRNIEENARTISNPGFVYINDAVDLPPGRIRLGPGEGLPLNPRYTSHIDDVIRFRDGSQMPPYVIQYWEGKKRACAEQAGLKPGMVGLAPVGTSHTTTMAVGSIQEASFSSMWAPNDEIVAAISDIGDRYLGLMQQYYKQGRIVDVSEEGESRFMEFSTRHIAARFSLEVVSGTTTPLYDIDRVTRMKEIKAEVDQALASGDPYLMKSTLALLVNMQYPYAADWIQLLRERIAELESQRQELGDMGAMELLSQQQGGGGQGMPAGMMGGQQPGAAGGLAELLGGAEPQGAGAPAEELDLSGLQALAEEAGVDPDRIMELLNAS